MFLALSSLAMVLGMSLDAGGHLTHGAAPNFSGKTYQAVQYGIDTETGLLDYDAIRALALEHKPKMLIGGFFSAYCASSIGPGSREIADEVGAWFLVDMAHVSGLVAAGVYPSPVPHTPTWSPPQPTKPSPGPALESSSPATTKPCTRS